MKFTCTVDIDAPINKVVALFSDPGNYREWQTGFAGIRNVAGTPRTVGAKSIIMYDTGKYKMDILETITEMNLPAGMTALYEHKHMVNTNAYSFIALPGNKTRYSTATEYTKFRGFMPKLMSLFMGGVFKKQTQKWLEQFKAFVERQ